MYQEIMSVALPKIMGIIYHMQGHSYLYAGLAMIMEGASVPFPGMYILIFSGFAIKQLGLNFWVLVGICSVCYTAASLIPYYIGGHINNIATKFYKKYYSNRMDKIKKVSDIFNKYGEWTVCLSRPTFLGNYFSYIAGMNSMNIGKFLLYTFAGIFPWTLFMCYLGYGVISSTDEIVNIIASMKPLFYIVTIAVIIYGAYQIYKLLNNKRY